DGIGVTAQLREPPAVEKELCGAIGDDCSEVCSVSGRCVGEAVIRRTTAVDARVAALRHRSATPAGRSSVFGHPSPRMHAPTKIRATHPPSSCTYSLAKWSSTGAGLQVKQRRLLWTLVP